MENSILEILTYYVIGGALLMVPQEYSSSLSSNLPFKIQRVAWLDIKITKLMEILPSTKTQK